MLLPLPRFRIYTHPWMYFSIFKDIVLNQSQKGDAIHLLEEKIKDRIGTFYAICMPQARVGIYFTVKAIIRPGQKVILSPYTISDVINMVICAGGIPVFADIERETGNIDPNEIERLIDTNTGAVLITHLHGYACDMNRIKKICKNQGVPLIEDAAQAFGTMYQSKSVGTFGEAGIFSFGMYKNVNAFYGGMVVTSNPNIYDRIQHEIENFPYQEITQYSLKVLNGFITDIATFPFIFKLFTFWIFQWGHINNIKFLTNQVAVDIAPKIKTVIPETYLRKMTPMQAKLIFSQLDKVNQNSETRIHFSHIYYEGLKDIGELIIAPFHEDKQHIYTYYTIQAPDRYALVKRLIEKKCDIAISHHKNCADLTAFKEFYRDCPNARKTAASLIFLPTYPRYSEQHVKKNIAVIKDFFKT